MPTCLREKDRTPRNGERTRQKRTRRQTQDRHLHSPNRLLSPSPAMTPWGGFGTFSFLVFFTFCFCVFTTAGKLQPHQEGARPSSTSEQSVSPPGLSRARTDAPHRHPMAPGLRKPETPPRTRAKAPGACGSRTGEGGLGKGRGPSPPSTTQTVTGPQLESWESCSAAAERGRSLSRPSQHQKSQTGTQ